MTTLRTGQTTDFSNQGTEFTVDSLDTDGTTLKETFYIPNFTKWHGFFRKIPELRSVINKFASWTFGRGIEADDTNKKKLKKIRGIGNESARSVLKNCWRTAMICGDSFAHILPGGNLKPLNPGKVAIVANADGIIIGYEMETSVDGTTIRFDVEEIYHLSFERIADEIHGIPFPEALEELIKSRNEGIEDLRTLYHRTVKPILFYEADTNDTAKLNSLEDVINEAFKNTESVILPFGVVKEIKHSSTPLFGTDKNNLEYIKFLVRQFVTGCGMPEVIMGWGEGVTEASGNIIYLAFQQEIEDMQLYNQEAADIQLNIIFNLEFPASIETNVKENENKRGKGTTTDPKKDG